MFLRPSVASVAETLENVPEDAAVLLSFDYGPAYAGEMDLLATELRIAMFCSGAADIAALRRPGVLISRQGDVDV